MIILSRHIENLLLTHDCVIVPEFGGFVAQYVPSRHDAEENLLLPPYRSIGFNPQLTLNDGLLAQSYAHAYGTDYRKTQRLIRESVTRLKEELQRVGEVELAGIGRLSVGSDGRYNFKSYESGIVSPELYGLEALPVPSTASLNARRNSAAKEGTKKRRLQIRRTERDYTISVSREIVNYAAAVVVVVASYLALTTTPSFKQNFGDGQQQAASIYEQFFKTAAQSNASAKTAKPQTVQQSATNNKAVAKATTTPQKQEKTAPKAEETKQTPMTGYTIVLASQVSRRNASHFVEELKHEGCPLASMHTKRHVLRVVYGNYSSEREAQNELQKLRKSHGRNFAEAWVMKL